jgi:hypothetical protein
MNDIAKPTPGLSEKPGMRPLPANVIDVIAPQEQNQQQFDFSKMHLHLCIPCYGGQITEPCFTSFLRFTLMAAKAGLSWSLDTMVNESLVTRARNNLVAKMLFNDKATHLMFIDADIRFQPESIFHMLMADKDVIGGLYPKKVLPISYVINARPGTPIINDIFEVDTMGTGFMMVKRSVLDKMIAAYPHTKYVDDVGLGKQFEPFMYALFDVEIDEKGHYLSEDWAFCRRWAKLGGKVYAHSKVLLNHTGFFEFQGDLDKLKMTNPEQHAMASPPPAA